MATKQPSGRWQHWATGGMAALLAVYLAIAAHWTSRDLVWSFWLTTLSSGVFLIAAPFILFASAAALHPGADTEETRVLFFSVAALIAVFTLILVVMHLFFFQFVDGLVPPIYARERIIILHQGGGRSISDAESLPVYYLLSLAAAAKEYWQFALLTLVCDIVALPWSRAGWRGIKPFSAVPMLGERIGKLMVVQGVVLGLAMADTLQNSIAVAVLVIAINFVPTGTFATLLGEASDGTESKGAR